MKAHIFVGTSAEIKEEASVAIEIHEEPPEWADPDTENGPRGGDGTLVLETSELEVEADFPLSEFPEELGLSVNYIGWDEKGEWLRLYGFELHTPADVTITLKRKWQDDKGKSVALYAVVLS